MMQVEWVWEFITPIPPCLFFLLLFYGDGNKYTWGVGMVWPEPPVVIHSQHQARPKSSGIHKLTSKHLCPIA